MFLQLFYLDVVSNGMTVLPKTVKPVMIWDMNEVKKVYEQVESMGGWKSESIYVTKKYLWDRTIQYSGSVDASTGIKTNVVEDLSEVRSEVGVVKGDIQNLKSMVGQLGPDMGRLRNAVMMLETSLEQLKAEGLFQLVSDSMKGVFEDKRNDYIGNDGSDLFADVQKQHGPYDDGMPSAKSKIVISTEVVPYWDGRTEVERNEQTRFEAVAEISHRDSYLLTYLFSKKVSADNSLGSNEVAKFEDWGVSRWDLSCLSPTQSLTTEVVNISSAYLCHSGSENWFLPAIVSERDKEILAGMQVEGIVPSTITLYRLQRFIGRLSSCKKMFLPIYDRAVKHWFLVVVNIPYDVPTTGQPPISLKEDGVLPTSGMKFNPRRLSC